MFYINECVPIEMLQIAVYNRLHLRLQFVGRIKRVGGRPGSDSTCSVSGMSNSLSARMSASVAAPLPAFGPSSLCFPRSAASRVMMPLLQCLIHSSYAALFGFINAVLCSLPKTKFIALLKAFTPFFVCLKSRHFFCTPYWNSCFSQWSIFLVSTVSDIIPGNQIQSF